MRFPLPYSLALCVLVASASGNGTAKESQPVLAYASDAAGNLDVFVTASEARHPGA